jgi:hypothetical protein
MTPKQKRIIESDLTVLFSTKAFLVLKTMEDWKAVGFFHPEVRTETNSRPLSEAGIAALRRITGILQEVLELRESCSLDEIAEQVHKSYEGWIGRSQRPDAGEFIESCTQTLLAQVTERTHLINLHGLELGDIVRLDLGAVFICKPDPSLLGKVQFGGAITEEWIMKDFSQGLWLIGRSFGSPKTSLARFDHHTILVIGMLAVCGALLFEGSIWQSHLRTGLSPERQSNVTAVFRWDSDGDNPTVHRLWGSDKALPLNQELVAYLRKECFLDELSKLPSKLTKTEIEEAIERALYWFADAHGDRNTTMRFIKLWSCVECFFAINKEEVTEANVRGIAITLTFAGYQVGSVEEYPKLKRRLKELYDLRSRAVHRAEFDGVQLQDLQDLSRWVGWVIISMMALAQRGYSLLKQVKEQTDRLDSSMQRAGAEQRP